jgi:hypothetical protein
MYTWYMSRQLFHVYYVCIQKLIYEIESGLADPSIDVIQPLNRQCWVCKQCLIHHLMTWCITSHKKDTITARHQYGTPSFLLTIALHWDLRSEISDLSLRITRAWMEHTMTVYMTWGMWLSPHHTTKLVTEIWLYACMWTSPCIDMLILYLACNLQWLLNI